jgi:hypothetical protein
MQTAVDMLSEGKCSADALRKESSAACSKKPIDLPPEVLYTILGDLVSGYLDLFITEPRRKTNPEASLVLPQEGSSGDSLAQLAETGVVGGPGTRDTQQDTTEEFPVNTIISLLLVSYSFRDITLKILSDILGIQQAADGRCANFPEHAFFSYCLYVYCISLSQSPRNMLKITRDLYHLGQTQILTRDQKFTDAKNQISQSPLLAAYVGLSIIEGHFRAPPDFLGSQAAKLNISEAEDAVLAGLRDFKPRILTQRAVHRTQSLSLTFDFGESFCLVWASARC